MIYAGTITAKTGHIVPLYKSGKPAHSKYNPAADKVSGTEETSGFIIVFGIGAGFHIKNLLANKNLIKIIAVEADNESLNFCKSLNTVKELEKDQRIIFCSLENFKDCLTSNYLPSLYYKITSFFLRSWHDEIPDADKKINELLTLALNFISADFSVQAHFGKHWHRNILSNLRFISEKNFVNSSIKIPQKKTKAFVIAAGPTLDSSIELLKKEKEAAFIISTDTAYGTLLGSGIIPDAVISVDAQQVSSEHFLGIKKTDTLFIFDLSSNPETVRMLYDVGNKIYFVRSSHPLAALAGEEINIPLTESGSGTVTIAAADWARQQDFKEIIFYGADFSYSDGKPYCRGTYLEKKFNTNSIRTLTAEGLYSALMFRTELKKINTALLGNCGSNPVTSSVLESYGTTLLLWAKKYGFVQNENAFTSGDLKSPGCSKKIFASNSSIKKFEYKKFIKAYTEKVQDLFNKINSIPTAEAINEILNSKELISLLPLFAAFGKDKISENLSLALQFLTYYNLHYENKK